jgi:hypothetical protein
MTTLQVEFALYVRRYAPFHSFGGGFEGDGRGFSTSLQATSRTVGVATFGPRGGTQVGGTGFSSGSSWVGPWEVRRHFPLGGIGKSVGDVRISVSNIVTGQGKIAFTLYTEGNLPLKDLVFHKSIAGAMDKVNNFLRPNSPRPQGSPDIDTFVDFAATFLGKKVLFEAVVRGDGFPNAEVFVLDAKSKAVALFDYRTKSGEAGPLHRLYGAHAGNRLGSVRREVDLNADGTFGPNFSQPPAVVQEA